MGGDLDFSPLGDLCDPDRGITYGIVKVGGFVPDGVPVIRGGDIRNGQIVFDHEKRVSEEVSQQFRRTILKGGEILINLIAEPGHTAIVPPSLIGANVSRDVAVVALNDAVNHRFVDYCLKSPAAVHWLTSRLQGSVTQKINLGTLRDLPIPMLALTEQHSIAEILGTLDDKIELNRRMNETLEAMARALFKSWFVDFDPVRAKAEGRISGTPTELSGLFPDTLIEAELGLSPLGWQIKPLPQAIEVNPSRSLRKGDVAPYLDMANMPTRGHCAGDVIDRPFGSGMRFVNGDTLVARITPCLENGKTAFVDFLEDDQVGWGSTEYIVMRPMPPLPEEFGYCLARSESFRDFAIQSMTGSSGRQRVPAESLSHYLIAVPDDAIAEQFGRLVRPIFAKITSAARQSRSLIALRDTLLPKLISGELRVKAAEKIVEAVA
ncbi:restriction endonuclease subunit S [Rhodopseudomonas sp. BR0M22]|uniref:restriction endonuclease subunit S n=1 Tax=Rhodopseudomonas sp. BR0M22 TaxID=2269369 RepID=UPI0013E0602A|nr:restriction endonuclease subunit S [Rhodopseudomonas sp. BR0M22]NEW92120.1 restriction endonuclease subunit S [Rhodopseudomonas sp. BR0M22]